VCSLKQTAGPFCHRALLTLEEKAVPYVPVYVDFNAKPQWLLDANPAGTVPLLREQGTEPWILDSGVIVNFLEEKFPDPPLGTAESAPQV
jgi:glutathione S-transferase